MLGRLLARLAEREAVNTLAELDAWLAARDAEAAAAARALRRARPAVARPRARSAGSRGWSAARFGGYGRCAAALDTGASHRGPGGRRG